MKTLGFDANYIVMAFRFEHNTPRGCLARSEVLLNHVFLKNRIAELGIKQWWLAEQIGVDRKTIIRWTQGQVRSIQIENAEKLAKILDCVLSDLTVKNEAEQLSTPEDQRTAAALLATSSLIEKLGPIGEWNVIEGLLKASLVPNLPLNVLGELYDQLTIASWRQSKIDQAAIYNTKTQEIAQKSGDKCLLASALLSKANIHSWRGQVSQSIAAYKQCIALEKYVEPKTLGAIYSNLGGVLYESGEVSEGENFIRKSIAVFNEFGKPINLSISHTHLAIIALQKGLVDVAETEAVISLQFAKHDDFRRGIQMVGLLQAEIASRRNQQTDAQRLIKESLAGFEALGIIEGLNFEIAGRTYRLIGKLDEAEDFLREGIKVSKSFPVYLAAIHCELAEVLRAKNSSSWVTEAQTAMNIFKQSECPKRVLEVKSRFGLK